jgi:predicted alpha/beta superfamily hydrolase
MDAQRRSWLLAAPALLLGCGGGGGESAPATPAPLQGQVETQIVRARALGVDYGVRLYTPPVAAGPRAALPLWVVLDGENWLDTVARASESAATPVLVAAVNSVSRRDTDYVPPNTCTSGGGGQAAYLAFLRDELLPAVQAQLGGHTGRRVLWGHSHGGGFVLQALLAEPTRPRVFDDHVACDASLGCYYDTAIAWQAAHAAAVRRLPARLHLSHASAGNVLSNVPWADALAARGFEGLVMRTQAYTGSHAGIVPQAVADALAWLRAGA